MKALFRIALLLIVIMVAVGAFFLFVPSGKASGEKFILIKNGSSARQIAGQLAQEGIIRHRYVFLALHAMKMKNLKAGEYKIDASHENVRNIYERMARGDVYYHQVVIPEGYNMWDIAGVLDKSGLCKGDDFLKVAKDPTPIRDFAPEAKTLEGYLFPDTYNLSRTQSCQDIANGMVKRFKQEAKAIGLSSNVHRTVTMASIVEKETRLPDERPLVAGVFENRLAHNTVLATDPAVIYAALLAGRYTGVIHQSDLAYDSPYNTYKYAGLPPGPIANPGRTALEAAMHPTKTDYFYFVANNTGGHNFARTAEEHARNVAGYRTGQPVPAR